MVSSTHALRSIREVLLVVPSAKEIQLVGTQKRAFSEMAPQLRYSLPVEAHLAPSLPSFQKSVKSELFQQVVCENLPP